MLDAQFPILRRILRVFALVALEGFFEGILALADVLFYLPYLIVKFWQALPKLHFEFIVFFQTANVMALSIGVHRRRLLCRPMPVRINMRIRMLLIEIGIGVDIFLADLHGHLGVGAACIQLLLLMKQAFNQFLLADVVVVVIVVVMVIMVVRSAMRSSLLPC